MKYLILKKETIEDLIEKEVELKSDRSDYDLAFENLRSLIWKVLIQPMELNKTNGLDFIYAFVKIKDAFAPAVKEKSNVYVVKLEDDHFRLLKETFEAFTDWNIQVARVILTASELLKTVTEQEPQ